MSEHDFTVAWRHGISESDWKSFLAYSFGEPDRAYVYSIIKSFLSGKTKAAVAEAGFGQCHDFVSFFKELHDSGAISYYGFDVTKQFADYASKTFPGYTFSASNFFADDSPQFDITYARGVLEHQDPDHGYSAFENLLKRTKSLSIVSWFMAPGAESMRWIPTDGLANSGAYVNIYSESKLADIVKKQGFQLCIKVLVGQLTTYVVYAMVRA